MNRVLDIDFDDDSHRCGYSKKLKLYEDDSDAATVDFNKLVNVESASVVSDSDNEINSRSVHEVVEDVDRGALLTKNVIVPNLTLSTPPKIKKKKKVKCSKM